MTAISPQFSRRCNEGTGGAGPDEMSPGLRSAPAQERWIAVRAVALSLRSAEPATLHATSTGRRARFAKGLKSIRTAERMSRSSGWQGESTAATRATAFLSALRPGRTSFVRPSDRPTRSIPPTADTDRAAGSVRSHHDLRAASARYPARPTTRWRASNRSR